MFSTITEKQNKTTKQNKTKQNDSNSEISEHWKQKILKRKTGHTCRIKNEINFRLKSTNTDS